ncbi:MAG: TerC family protein [Bacteroidia bacterium]|nr:TerC family protein [Bacteroidia bacterium]
MELFHSLFGNEWGPAIVVILNLLLIESLLSVDNAAVLATMVRDLQPEEQKRALKYGIFGAYFFRGVCLLFASWLVKFWFLKFLGGAYLLYLAIDYFFTKPTPKHEHEILDKQHKPLYRWTLGLFGRFWATVILVELMDLAFSIDNVFAAVAFTDKLGLIWVGVFIGILAMRFVAQFFVNLMNRYPYLETSAFVVIAILGIKLCLSLPFHFFPEASFTHFMESEATDIFVSVMTVIIFFVPILTTTLYKKRQVSVGQEKAEKRKHKGTSADLN